MIRRVNPEKPKSGGFDEASKQERLDRVSKQERRLERIKTRHELLKKGILERERSGGPEAYAEQLEMRGRVAGKKLSKENANAWFEGMAVRAGFKPNQIKRIKRTPHFNPEEAAVALNSLVRWRKDNRLGPKTSQMKKMQSRFVGIISRNGRESKNGGMPAYQIINELGLFEVPEAKPPVKAGKPKESKPRRKIIDPQSLEEKKKHARRLLKNLDENPRSAPEISKEVGLTKGVVKGLATSEQLEQLGRVGVAKRTQAIKNRYGLAGKDEQIEKALEGHETAKQIARRLDVSVSAVARASANRSAKLGRRRPVKHTKPKSLTPAEEAKIRKFLSHPLKFPLVAIARVFEVSPDQIKKLASPERKKAARAAASDGKLVRPKIEKGFSDAEIAEATGVDVKVVEMLRLSKDPKKFKEYLGKLSEQM